MLHLLHKTLQGAGAPGDTCHHRRALGVSECQRIGVRSEGTCPINLEIGIFAFLQVCMVKRQLYANYASYKRVSQIGRGYVMNDASLTAKTTPPHSNVQFVAARMLDGIVHT